VLSQKGAKLYSYQYTTFECQQKHQGSVEHLCQPEANQSGCRTTKNKY
jgi:hypothetical protein